MDGQRVTRLEMFQFIKEHEVAHRAQLFLYLRLKGIVPATTRRRRPNKQLATGGDFRIKENAARFVEEC